MMGKTGYDLCASLRAEGALASGRCLILTGNFSPYDEARGTKAGADGYVVKPFETQALIDKVADAIATRGGRAGAAAPRLRRRRRRFVATQRRRRKDDSLEISDSKAARACRRRCRRRRPRAAVRRRHRPPRPRPPTAPPQARTMMGIPAPTPPRRRAPPPIAARAAARRLAGAAPPPAGRVRRRRPPIAARPRRRRPPRMRGDAGVGAADAARADDSRACRCRRRPAGKAPEAAKRPPPPRATLMGIPDGESGEPAARRRGAAAGDGQAGRALGAAGGARADPGGRRPPCRTAASAAHAPMVGAVADRAVAEIERARRRLRSRRPSCRAK